MKKSTILIAGGAGFLGSHLCDLYLERGFRVFCIDNLSTGSEDNISHLVSHPDFYFENIDISAKLSPSIEKETFSIVANLASPASPPHYQRLAIETLMTGAEGTLNLLDLARDNHARFFHASTSEVYGDPKVHPQPESYRGSVNCYGPRSMYDEAKRFAEALIYSYRRKHHVSTVVARFFNTYGPRMDQDDGRVVSNFVVQALTGKPITIYGQGTQTRSFCYVSDLISGIEKLIQSEEEGPMNLGNPKEFTVKELADIVVKLTKSSSEIEFRPLPEDDPLQREPVITLAKEKLNWQPAVELEEGLRLTIDYFKDKVSPAVAIKV